MKTFEAYLYIQLCLESCLQNFSQAIYSEIQQGTKSQQTAVGAAGSNYPPQQQKSVVRHPSCLITPTA